MTEDPTIKLTSGRVLRVLYTNWKGEKRVRNIQLTSAPIWAKTEWHPTPGWLIHGTDLDRNVERV